MIRLKSASSELLTSYFLHFYNVLLFLSPKLLMKINSLRFSEVYFTVYKPTNRSGGPPNGKYLVTVTTV